MFLFGLIVILFLISGGILKVVLKRLIYVLTCTICGSNDKEEVDIEHSPFTAGNVAANSTCPKHTLCDDDDVNNVGGCVPSAYSEVVSEDDMTTLFSKGGWSRQNKVRPSDKHHHGGTFDVRHGVSLSCAKCALSSPQQTIVCASLTACERERAKHPHQVCVYAANVVFSIVP